MQQHKQIKFRTLANGSVSYYLGDSGLALSNISTIAVEGYEASAFTVTKEDGKYYTRLPVKDKITKYHLPDIMNNLGKRIYLVA